MPYYTELSLQIFQKVLKYLKEYSEPVALDILATE
jgi:hypothetical protein